MSLYRITDIQRFTTRDGPGVRDTVFLKGCSLRCLWCHNPEALSTAPELCFHIKKCVGCGACAASCPEGRFVHGRGRHVFDEVCLDCGRCADVCPTGAIAWASRDMSAEEIVAAVLRDKPFYRPGGVTLSGGEPLLAPEVRGLLAALRRNGLHTAVDTALNVPWDHIEAALPYTMLFLVDIKAMDPKVHLALTGAGNGLILQNIRRLAAIRAPMWIRVPVIPENNIGELPDIAGFIRGLGRSDVPVELIPYHDMAAGKYASLGREMPLQGLKPPDRQTMDACKRIFDGIPSVSYGAKPDDCPGTA